MSGKSALAKMLAANYRKQGFNVLVLDPLAAPDWQGTVTADPDAFMYYAKRVANLRLFVDEGAQSLGRDVDYNWLATQARHWGHRTHFISQRPQDFTPHIRGNCHTLWLFAIDGGASDILAREFNKSLLKDAPALPQLQFKWCQRFADVRSGKIEFAKRSIVWLPANVGAGVGSPSDSTTPAPAQASSTASKRSRKKCA